jgi:hypothetical protein
MRFVRLLLLMAVLGLCGCAGYRLGPTNGQEAGAKSVQITPFVNNSKEPGLADEMTSALRRSIQNDGTYRLATDGSADLLVEGVIKDFRRRELSLLTEDSRTVTDYQISLVVHLKVTQRGTGDVVLDRDVTGGSIMRVGEDLAASERQLAPILARDLSRQITHLLADGSW